MKVLGHGKQAPNVLNTVIHTTLFQKKFSDGLNTQSTDQQLDLLTITPMSWCLSKKHRKDFHTLQSCQTGSS